MYLNIGQNNLLSEEEIIGVFDLDNTTWSIRTRDFLERAEREGRVRTAGDDLPKSFLLCEGRDGTALVYLTQLTTAALRGRAENLNF